MTPAAPMIDTKKQTDAPSEPDFSPGTMGCHEALHMASFLTSVIEREILNHPAIKANPEWKKLAQRSFGAMAKLYQKIGEKHL